MHRLNCLLITLLTLISISAQAGSNSWVTASNSTVNFGYVPQNGEFSRTITLRSNVNDTIRIGTISTYCDCVIANLSNDILYPGDSVTLEFKFNTKNLVGKQYKVTHIYDENDARLAKVTVMATAYKETTNFKTIIVEPAILNFSQFGDKGIDEAAYYIKNVSDETVPLELMFTNSEYFDLDFPVYVESNKKAKGTVKLTEKGKRSEFGESFTFKYIDDKSEEYLFSISIKRKVFKSKSDGK